MNEKEFLELLEAVGELNLAQYERLFERLHQHFAWGDRIRDNRRYKPAAIGWRLKQALLLLAFANGKSPNSYAPSQEERNREADERALRQRAELIANQQTP